MSRAWIQAGAAFGFCGVALGAFGAHALKGRIPADLQPAYQTAVQYHLVHTLALLALAALAPRLAPTAVNVAGWAFAAGIVLFSGSLYLLAITAIRPLGAITPFGGLAFLIGWAALGWAAWT